MLLSSILSQFYKEYNARSGSTHLSTYLSDDPVLPTLAPRAQPHNHNSFFVVAACLIPVLVLLSGIFAGLTLGYMSLDETQLNVLASSGTAKQREYANKIIPVRKNGHLLLVSLLLANMITNETLPVISDEVLGGGVPAVAVSTVLIVIFSEIIPQSICTRYGLYIGAKFAIPVRILMYSLYIVAWPVAKLLEIVLGPHHGIIYRRGELKELINMHSSVSPHGGDLKHDTVTIIGHTLDLQEKVVRDAMTPITSVFMLPLDACLDYATLRKVCESGHSRVPVYEEIDVPVYKGGDGTGNGGKAKKIVGILLVKQCVLLDPKEATPVRSIPLNTVPSVPFDEPLLGILDRFQEGRSHMAIVSLYSKGRAASVKEAVKTGLTRRFLNRVGFGEDEEGGGKKDKDLEKAWGELREGRIGNTAENSGKEKVKVKRFTASIEGREQAMPADAVLASEDADDFLRGVDTDVNPLGIITLEDVLEELIGEEILDEFDLTGPQAASSYIPPSAKRAAEEQSSRTLAHAGPAGSTTLFAPIPIAVSRTPMLSTLQFPRVASGLSIFSRARSQSGTPRVDTPVLLAENVAAAEKGKEKELLMVGGSGAGSGLGMTSSDGGSVLPELRSDETDGMTLRATQTFETGTTTVVGTTLGDHDDGLNVMTDAGGVPNILLLDERGQSRATAQHQHHSSPPSATATLAPRVTEAILQTQTRRRAQLQQQAHVQGQPSPSASNSVLSMGGGSDAVGDMLTRMQQTQASLPLPPPTPAPRSGHKGRFKSSPLVLSKSSVTPPHVAAEEKGIKDIYEKGGVVDMNGVPESDPESKDPKEGL